MGSERRNERQPTINDVARVAGVSKKPVSRVINRSPLLKDDTRQKVESVIAELGYVPNPQARALALRRNFLLGLLHDNPNAQTVLNFQIGVLDAIRDTNFALVVRPVNRHSPNMLDDIRDFLEKQRLYGVFILPPISENEELAALCRELDCAYVRMGSTQLDSPQYLVESNDREIVASAVDHLVEMGHRRIGLIEGPEGFRSAFERREGFLDGIRRHGLEYRAEWHAPGQYTFDSGIEAAERILSLPDACRTKQGPAGARRLVDHRLRRQPHRLAYLAAAHHRALAHPRDGKRRGAQADRFRRCRSTALAPAVAADPPVLGRAAARKMIVPAG